MPEERKDIRNWSNLRGLSRDEIEETARAVLSEMSLEEKAGQLQGDRPFIRGLVSMLRRYNKEPYPAGACPRLGIPPILFGDGPRGVVVGNSTCFPVPIARAASWDASLEERIGEAIGTELRAQGGNYFGGVCINLLRHPSWGRAQESYGEDSFLTGEMGAALVQGAQKHVIACIKHYAANSMENARFKVDVQVDERSLREVYLPHFERCVNAGAASVMGAYNKVNGDRCCENKHLLRNILKGDWGFDGFVISDFIFAVKDGRKALNAGLDVEMPLPFRMKPKNILKWVRAGNVSEAVIDEAVLRILRTKLRFNRDPEPSMYSKDKIASPAHRALALEAARKGIVLLQNKNRFLPLSKNATKKIAVIGKLANVGNIGDRGSSRVYPNYVISPYKGIRNLVGEDTEVVLLESDNPRRASRIAAGVDAVIVVAGYTHKEEGEYVAAGVFSKGGDRIRLELPEKQERLISAVAEVNARTVVVIETGSAVITTNWKDRVAAVMMAWYPGMEGGNAIAEVIFGETNPSGKLPVGLPSSQDQLPHFDKNAGSLTYDFYHGYFLVDVKGYRPAFPFGFGLSFTDFAYSNLRLDKESYRSGEAILASVDVENTGSMPGDEIVQLYVGYEGSSVDRHLKDLRGFSRVSLFPGETETVTMNVPLSSLAFYSIEKAAWEVERITYRVLVGPSSQNDALLRTSCMVH